MNRWLYLFAFVLIPKGSVAQHAISSDAFHISFQTTEALANYDTGENYILGYDNENYAVDIAMIPYANETPLFLKDIQKGAWELAQDMGFNQIEDGGKIPFVDDAYYVRATEFDAELEMIVTVYVVALLYPVKGVAYEITVYCYTTNVSEGESIVKSLRLIE